MLKLNDVVVTPTIFPDRTSQVWKLPDHVFNFPLADIEWTFESEGELMQLVQLVDLISGHFHAKLLTLRYLPYGRQDKFVSNDATFALRSFAKVLNSLGFSSVQIHDPHSSVALDLIKGSYATYPTSEVVQVAELNSIDMLCFPDKGAIDKYRSIYQGVAPYIYGEKVREPLTGNITHYQVVGNPQGKRVLIVDDICDGGMTFKILAKDLLAAGAKSVVLFVTHGIFSKGLQTLRDSGIQRIYTQDGEASEDEGSIMYRRLS